MIAVVLIVIVIAAIAIPKAINKSKNNIVNGILGGDGIGSLIPGMTGGTGVYTDGDGNTVVQNKDGTIDVRGEDGAVAHIGSEWPNNEYTKLIPKPDFEIVITTTSEEGFSASFQNVTVAQLKDYVNQIIKKGFTVDSTTTDEEMLGMAVYAYEASNAAGYKISVYSTAGIAGLTIEKP